MANAMIEETRAGLSDVILGAATLLPDILAEKASDPIRADLPDEIKAEKAAILFEGRQVKAQRIG